MVEALLTGFVKESYVADLDFNTLELCSSEFITANLQRRIGDCVWRVRWRGKNSYLYVLIEFQSSNDQQMPVRIMSYTTLLWENLVKTEEKSRSDPLPPVLPIVIYNGQNSWTASPSVEEMSEEVPPGLEPYHNGRGYFLVDEKRCDPGADPCNLFSFVVRLENAVHSDEIRNIVSALDQRLPPSQYQELRRLFSTWIGQLVYKKAGIEDQAPEFKDLLEVDKMLAEEPRTWKDTWTAEGHDAGFKEGEAKGEARGVAKGELMTLAANIKSLMASLKITRERALDLLNVSAEKREKLAAFQ